LLEGVLIAMKKNKLVDHRGRRIEGRVRGRLILDDNPKEAVGETKVDLTALPAAGVIHGARAAQYGNAKYGYYNHRYSRVSLRQYMAAVLRHVYAVIDGEDVALDSMEEHLGHVIAGASIVLDAKERGNLVDDRPPRGPAGRLVVQKIGVKKSKLEMRVTVEADPTVKAFAERIDREFMKLSKKGKNL
jgi:hypothetical protein